MGNIIANNEIPAYYGGDTKENEEAWRAKTREIQLVQPWLDDESARMEAKKQIFGFKVNG